MRTIDEGFVARVYRTSAVVGAIGLFACWAFWGLLAAAGWIAGALVSIGTVRSLEYIIKRSFQPGNTRAKGSLAKFSLLKLPVLLVILGLAVWVGKFNSAFIIAFCAGVILAQTVIALKAVGLLVCERLKV